ncbi:MAG: radical SAM protein [Coriobacteriales bacterium]|jgi:nitrogenase molybdenum-iron protein alpha/beta subunit/MoaA/NifB/PqqE/SkfB family radical SAM enzyme|nr:radical SAM protein [Coriobacteriales bacterium]
MNNTTGTTEIIGATEAAEAAEAAGTTGAKALISLDVNPCKMCMPMGVVTAAYGIEGNMVVLHGSQGCATYIRRHMATHYNEPIDIASSALTEQGTVYGGAKNLERALDNFIRLYNPFAITVATTCLAETIGEDVNGILDSWREAHPQTTVQMIPVISPGYGGTQFEGHFAFLAALLKNVEMNSAPTGRVNIVCGPMSPADVRWLKQLVCQLGIDAIIVPDCSQALDGQHTEVYSRVHEGGTRIADVLQMAGSKHTIEIAKYLPEKLSPGALLKREYNVPYTRLNLPVGLRDIDALVNALKPFATLANVEHAELKLERGRYLDAMIDSHKYNALGRAVVFGEPDFVYSVARMCAEQGIMPVLVATASKCPALYADLEAELAPLAESMLVEKWRVIDEADFATIEELSVSLGANVLIGSSDARRIAKALDIPLVRAAFPIHDHMGGQRVRTIGYEGSQALIDRITNALIDQCEGSFREKLKAKYLVQPDTAFAVETTSRCLSNPDASLPVRTARQYLSDSVKRLCKHPTHEHPCFSKRCATKSTRIHLPVAPKCNITCNYCLRKYDCPNESRPGVSSVVLSPPQALKRYLDFKQQTGKVAIVGIAGPGDALANFDNTKETLRLIREVDKDVGFCLSTNGLLLARYAHTLAELEVSHVTVTMNAIDPAIGARICPWVSLDNLVYTGEAAAAVLLANQIEGIKALVSLGIIVKVNTVYIKGVNDAHVESVAQMAHRLGASVQNLMRMVSVKGSVFENYPQVDKPTLLEARVACSKHLSQMRHCRQCRADAAGLLGKDLLVRSLAERRTVVFQ